MLAEIGNELKPVLAGSHDRSLDGKHWKSHLWEGKDLKEHLGPENDDGAACY